MVISVPPPVYTDSVTVLTINVPLFKKLRDIIFFWWDNHFMSHFEGHFEGAKTFLTGQFRGQKSRGPLKMSEKWLIK